MRFRRKKKQTLPPPRRDENGAEIYYEWINPDFYHYDGQGRLIRNDTGKVVHD